MRKRIIFKNENFSFFEFLNRNFDCGELLCFIGDGVNKSLDQDGIDLFNKMTRTESNCFVFKNELGLINNVYGLFEGGSDCFKTLELFYEYFYVLRVFSLQSTVSAEAVEEVLINHANDWIQGEDLVDDGYTDLVITSLIEKNGVEIITGKTPKGS